MRLKFHTAIIIALSFYNVSINAQTNTFPSTGAVGIGTTSPNVSSLLEIKSTKKGLLIPRMTKNQRDAIVSPATGLLIYQTNNTAGFYYYNGSTWKPVTAKTNGWSLTGNAGTDSSINFIGTTDEHSLVFRVGGVQAGLIEYGTCCSGKRNTAFGLRALYSNTTGIDNTANGYGSLYSNTTGNFNAATGKYALFNNNADNNTAFGFNAMFFNTSGIYNTATGSVALQNNTTGSLNTATGYAALYANNGNYNVATGSSALYQNATGSTNVATGSSALYQNTTGSDNVANGYAALYYNTTGNSNTALGSGAGNNATNPDLSYTTVIGTRAIATANYQVRIGSIGGAGDPTSIGGKVDWSTLSDGRVKKNIKENVPGLVFINKLKPVTYTVDNDAVNKITQRNPVNGKDGNTIKPFSDELSAGKTNTAIIYTGFVAQDVEKAAKSLKYDFSGVDAAKNDKDLYGLRYAEFVVPLVKAVQELSKMNDDKDSTIQQLITRLNNQQNEIDQLKAIMVSSQSKANSQQSTVLSSASVQQNIPNPFTNTTSIGYSLPQKFTSAQIIITDKSGKILKAINISGSKGNIKVDASTLASGAYQYSLIVDGRLINTKQMMLAK